MQVAQVSSIEGKFFAKDPKGNVRALQVGDSINEGEVVFGDNSNKASNKVVVELYNDVTAQVTASGEHLFDATMNATAHGNEEMSFNIATIGEFLQTGDIADVVSDLREAEFASEELDVENNGSQAQDKKNFADDEDMLNEKKSEESKEEDSEQLNLNFQFRDGNSVDVISDLREKEFVNRSQDTIEERKFKSEDENRLDNEYSGTRYSNFTPPPSPTIVQSTPTPPIELPVSVTPEPNISPAAPQPEINATISLNDTTVEEGKGTATLTVSVDIPPLEDLKITLSNGATVLIPAGETSATTSPFPIQEDDVYINNESYEVSVQEIQGGGYDNFDTTDTATVTINDTTDTTTVSIAGVDVNEDEENTTFTVTLSNPTDVNSPATITVDVGGVDYTVTIPAGATSASFDVPTQDSDVYVDPSTLTATVTNVEGGNW